MYVLSYVLSLEIIPLPGKTEHNTQYVVVYYCNYNSDISKYLDKSHEKLMLTITIDYCRYMAEILPIRRKTLSNQSIQ